MTVHLQKLCVGINTVQELVEYRDNLAKRLKKSGRPLEDQHWTRHRPKRDEEILDGGSLYWIIKGSLCVRQRILRLEDVADEAGKSYCAIVYDPTVILTESRPRRAFQGWRYLEDADAPPDLPDQRAALRQAAATAEMPEEMARELRILGLL
ncbi:MAG TPA: DUF1489 domain-containing protein [Dongiaceae bacterium]|nr:DUF1489 domain-containing protein [Dongiaceae bacterium]